MKTHLSNREVKELIAAIESSFGIKEIADKKDIFIVEDNIVRINNIPSFFYHELCHEARLAPTLRLILNLGEKIAETCIKRVKVDRGAIRFVVNGADIMRPGIKYIQEGIKKDEIVVVVDEEHSKPLAICIALLDYEEMKNAAQGKVLKNIHYIGDDIWKSC